MSIGILNIGLGNVHAVANALSRLGVFYRMVQDEKSLLSCTKLIIAGVCSFDTFMQSLKGHQLEHSLIHAIQQKEMPVLGICLGLQVLTRESGEGQTPGLALLDGVTVPVPDQEQKLPHFGWEPVTGHAGSRLLKDIPEAERRFYFSHSYAVALEDESQVSGTACYGEHQIPAIVEAGHIAGVQFHPEKSGRQGEKVLQNFIEHYS